MSSAFTSNIMDILQKILDIRDKFQGNRTPSYAMHFYSEDALHTCKLITNQDSAYNQWPLNEHYIQVSAFCTSLHKGLSL